MRDVVREIGERGEILPDGNLRKGTDQHFQGGEERGRRKEGDRQTLFIIRAAVHHPLACRRMRVFILGYCPLWSVRKMCVYFV